MVLYGFCDMDFVTNYFSMDIFVIQNEIGNGFKALRYVVG